MTPLLIYIVFVLCIIIGLARSQVITGVDVISASKDTFNLGVISLFSTFPGLSEFYDNSTVVTVPNMRGLYFFNVFSQQSSPHHEKTLGVSGSIPYALTVIETRIYIFMPFQIWIYAAPANVLSTTNGTWTNVSQSICTCDSATTTQKQVAGTSKVIFTCCWNIILFDSSTNTFTNRSIPTTSLLASSQSLALATPVKVFVRTASSSDFVQVYDIASGTWSSVSNITNNNQLDPSAAWGTQFCGYYWTSYLIPPQLKCSDGSQYSLPSGFTGIFYRSQSSNIDNFFVFVESNNHLMGIFDMASKAWTTINVTAKFANLSMNFVNYPPGIKPPAVTSVGKRFVL